MKPIVLAASLLWLAGFFFLPHAEQPAAPASFSLEGEVLNPEQVDLAKLKSLPTVSANVTYEAGGNVKTHRFTGPLLWDLLQDAGIKLDPKVKKDILRKAVIVTASDGYVAVFGAGELDPASVGAPIFLAYAQDQEPLRQGGFVRIIAAQDKTGARFVHDILRIEVRDVVLAPAEALPSPRSN